MKWIIPFLVILLLTGCTPLMSVEQSREMMDTTITITALGEDKAVLEDAIAEAFKEMERIDDLLGPYEYSEVGKLNKNKILENPSMDLRYNLEKSAYYSQLSDGAFDITVQPILDLYTASFSEKQRAPTEKEINETLKLVDYTNVVAYDDIKLNNNAKITLGGIAKGYAVDRAVEVLKANGVKHALVNAGGDVRALGRKHITDWTIALENPRNKEDFITIIKLNDKAVTTSGDYERYFEPTKKFHHIVNPKTGYSATQLISVTIIADTAIDADALSTTVFVLGKEKGMELIEELDNVEGLIITAERDIVKSSGFEKYTR